MKNWYTNLDEVLELIDQFSQYDAESMKTIICTLIDVASETCEESAEDIAVFVCSMVHIMNEERGPFTSRRYGYDYKN